MAETQRAETCPDCGQELEPEEIVRQNSSGILKRGDCGSSGACAMRLSLSPCVGISSWWRRWRSWLRSAG